MMKEKPILFNGDMVKAILEGRKTQTRRVKGIADLDLLNCRFDGNRWQRHMGYPIGHVDIPCPYGEIRDRLWVRETWQSCPRCGVLNYRCGANENGTVCQHCDSFLGNWKPSIFMFREFSRITLEVTDVSCERVQDISEADAFEEGICGGDWLGDPVGEFKKLWDSINKKRGYGWDKNPWVWAVSFWKVTMIDTKSDLAG